MNTSLDEVKSILELQGAAFAAFQTKNDDRIATLESVLGDIEKKAGRPDLGGSGAQSPTQLKALDGAIRALLRGDQSKADQLFSEAETKGMSADSDPAGGYTVVPTFSSELTKVMAEISPMSRLARNIPLDHGDSFEEIVDKDQAEASWVGEVSARTDTDNPDLGLFRVTLDEMFAMPKASQKLIDVSSFDIVGWLQGKVAEAFAAKESAAFFNGTGVAQPRGILTYPTDATADASRTWGTFEHIATGASGAFPTASTSVNSADVLIDVTTALKDQYRAGASWMMCRTTAGAVRKMKDADGRHVWQDSLIAGTPSTLLGYPVYLSEDMPTIGAGTLSIAFGNWNKCYTIIRKPGVKFLTDPYTDKPNVRLYAYARVGAGANHFEACKFLKFS
jgi:HK97 family phage major capsid protein